MGGAGFIGCDVLDQKGLDRIAGLDALVPPLATPLGPVLAASSSSDCQLTGPNVWGDGNILLGGAGSDLIEGRGADDVIDGDAYLSVRLSVRTNPADPATEIGSAGIEGPGQSAMTSQYLRTTAGALTGPTLQQAVFAGTVNPGDIVAVREVLSNPGASDVDTAQFSGPRADYDITLGIGVVTVAHTRGCSHRRDGHRPQRRAAEVLRPDGADHPARGDGAWRARDRDGHRGQCLGDRELDGTGQ